MRRARLAGLAGLDTLRSIGRRGPRRRRRYGRGAAVRRAGGPGVEDMACLEPCGTRLHSCGVARAAGAKGDSRGESLVTGFVPANHSGQLRGRIWLCRLENHIGTHRYTTTSISEAKHTVLGQGLPYHKQDLRPEPIIGGGRGCGALEVWAKLLGRPLRDGWVNTRCRQSQLIHSLSYGCLQQVT